MDNENRNTGGWNTGDWNTGNRNTGNRNTGNRNTGGWNTGGWNTGDLNTGDWNTGNRNTGGWNTVDRENGFFNTIEVQKIRVFNKECSLETWNSCKKPSFLFFKLTEWISSNKMTDAEKDANPTHKITGGYLKEYEYKEAFKRSYSGASEEDKKLLLELPNFDADVFLEISGIDVRKPDNVKEIERIQERINDLQKELDKLK
ncbi:hypothetical protein AB832_07890 [Flavobacteriaceae bacterium (ex Bugula neritina AB1)]|nr:hypothetical protein AB832_07890 [Flavobacteriaceae bacterium (ex Bugula neritina AB1)]